ncbi:hypothetical protein IGW_03817 [Bacillus cereus ISP3191]|nr:hypothetical protein BCW_0970 [Bacillus cereus W]EEM61244.1 hypothetical protein bthur0007_8690 [Bacillus thuringiensis serovar monterrey BGSC 4AJ1]EJQ92010.1 hypothetical protein IGW_03817 [Bacillus cereus ISP3191]CUB35338.1 hypothetical protein BN2127_JRS4_02215 [Bacillus cereus]
MEKIYIPKLPIGNELLPIVPVVFVEEINQSLMIYRRKQ